MRPSARLSALFTPLRLVVFGVVCLSISGMMFATQYHNAEYTQTELRRPQAAVVTRDPRDVRRSLNAQAQSRLARISLYNRNSSSAFDPIIPSNLNRYDLARANKIIHTVCPQINQTLYGPNGEAIPSLRVVAAGMGRSGSTWQFNAIIHILREAGIEPATKHGQLKDFLSLGLTLGCQYSVVKCHQFHPYFLEIADYVITSHRDTRDSYASLVDLKADEMFGHYWGEYLRVRPFACIDMTYEEFYLNQIREIDRLIQTLPVPKWVNATRVWHLVEGDRVSANRTKAKSFWHPKSGYYSAHVRDPEPGRWQKLLGSNWTDALYFVENPVAVLVKDAKLVPKFSAYSVPRKALPFGIKGEAVELPMLPNMSYVTIVAWKKQVGDVVSKGDELAELKSGYHTHSLKYPYETRGYVAKHFYADGADQLYYRDVLAAVVFDKADAPKLKDFAFPPRFPSPPK